MQDKKRKDDVMQGHEPRNEANILPGKDKEIDSPVEP